MRLFLFIFALFALLAFTHVADSACGGGAGRGGSRARIFARSSGGGGNSMTRVKIKSRGSRGGGGAGGCK